MHRVALSMAAAALAFVPIAASEQASGPLARPPGSAIATDADCAADLGTGDRSRRRFCDVVVAATGAESISVPIPPRRGPATLMIDLHNRFTVPAEDRPLAEAYRRHSAVVAVVGPDGAVLARAAVAREFRTVQDLFDRLGGGGTPGGLKAAAPGQAESVRFEIPEGLASVGIVGVRLEELTWRGLEVFDAPGRPVAMASNLRVEYMPR
jgi:hypothetical protein